MEGGKSAFLIAEIRKRERSGAIELPRHRPRASDRVQIVSGLLAGRRGRYAGEASHRHIKVLLQLLGASAQCGSVPTPSSRSDSIKREAVALLHLVSIAVN